jgi:hypothetical protein
MKTSVPNTPNETLRHSSLGITAFVLTLFLDFFFLIGALAGITQTELPKSEPVGLIVWLLLISSTVLAIVDLNKPNRKKTLPKLALIFGVGILVVSIVLMVIAMLLFAATF